MSNADDRLAEIAAREAKATPGPWEYDGEHQEIIAERSKSYWLLVSHARSTPDQEYHTDQFGHHFDHNFEFIAHARQDIPWLIAQVQQLQRDLAAKTTAYDAAIDLLERAKPFVPTCQYRMLYRDIDFARAAAGRTEFCCPKCGSPYCGRIIKDGGEVGDLRCHGESSAGNAVCDWVGEWPQPARKLPQIEDLYGINITDGVDPTEYIRRLRDGEV